MFNLPGGEAQEAAHREKWEVENSRVRRLICVPHLLLRVRDWKTMRLLSFHPPFLIIWFHFSEHLWQTSLCLMWAKSWTMDSDRSSSLFSSTWKKTCSMVRVQACKPGSVCLILTNSARRFENTCETCGSPQGASILRRHQGLRSSLPLHHAWLPGKFHALRQ